MYNENKSQSQPDIDQNALSKTLEAIMREIADLRAGQDKQNKAAKNSSQADWRSRPDRCTEREWSTQEQHNIK